MRAPKFDKEFGKERIYTRTALILLKVHFPYAKIILNCVRYVTKQ